MSNWKVNRRYFITTSGAVLLLPLMESLDRISGVSKAFAATSSGDPKRFIGIYWPNGTYNQSGGPPGGGLPPWYPATGRMQAGSLPVVLSPFANNIGTFSSLTGIGMAARDLAISRGGGDHSSGVSSWLTQLAYTDTGSNQSSIPGPSFDTIVSQKTGKPGMALGGGGNGGGTDGLGFNYMSFISFDQNGQPIHPISNPTNVYNQLFANLVPSNGKPSGGGGPTAGSRGKSVLDNVMANIKSLQSQLGKTDKSKLDSYLTSIRKMESKLVTQPPPMASSCTKGSPPGINDTDNSATELNYTQRMQQFHDIILLAFECDLTRSVSIMMDSDAGDRTLRDQVPSSLRYGGVGSIDADIHIGVSHYGTNGNGPELCITRDRYFMFLLMDLVAKLQSGIDSSGVSILDNSIVVSGFGIRDGNHGGGSAGVPLIVSGGANLGTHPGASYNAGGYDMVDLYYTISKMLGLGLSNFNGSSRTVNI